MRNLRVLATDQRTDNTTDENGKTVVKTFPTVPVEATPKIAEEIAVSQNVGELSLSLRPIADHQTQLEAANAAGDVTVPDVAPKADQARMPKLASQPVQGASPY